MAERVATLAGLTDAIMGVRSCCALGIDDTAPS